VIGGLFVARLPPLPLGDGPARRRVGKRPRARVRARGIDLDLAARGALAAPASSGPSGSRSRRTAALCVTGSGSDDVVAVDLATLGVSPLVAAGAGGLDAPRDLAWHGDELLVASVASNAALAYDAAGSFVGVAARGLSRLPTAAWPSPPAVACSSRAAPTMDVVEYDAESGGERRKFFDACPNLAGGALRRERRPGRGSLRELSGLRRRLPLRQPPPATPWASSCRADRAASRVRAAWPSVRTAISTWRARPERSSSTTARAVLPRRLRRRERNGGGPLDPWGLAFHEGSLFVASFFPARCESSTRRRAPSCRPSCRRDREALGPDGARVRPQGDLFVTSSGDDSISAMPARPAHSSAPS